MSLTIAALLFIGGVILHEAGHAVAAVLLGAQIVRVNVIGLDVWPAFRLNVQPGYWGRIWWQGQLAPPQRAWVSLSGNLATLAVSLVALPVFLTLSAPAHTPAREGQVYRVPCGQTALAMLSLFFLDSLLHTLPTLGLPIYLFFGRRDPATGSEGYLAATALGCPGTFFQGGIVAYSLLASGLVGYRLFRNSFGHREQSRHRSR